MKRDVKCRCTNKSDPNTHLNFAFKMFLMINDKTRIYQKVLTRLLLWLLLYWSLLIVWCNWIYGCYLV